MVSQKPWSRRTSAERDGNSQGSLAMQVTAVVSQFASGFKSEGEPGSGASVWGQLKQWCWWRVAAG